MVHGYFYGIYFWMDALVNGCFWYTVVLRFCLFVFVFGMVVLVLELVHCGALCLAWSKEKLVCRGWLVFASVFACYLDILIIIVSYLASRTSSTDYIVIRSRATRIHASLGAAAISR
jgi:hypothetical protein